MKVTHVTRRGALSLAGALGLAAVLPVIPTATTVTATPAAAAGRDTEYTEQDARDFAKIWLAGGISAAQMRKLADETGRRQNIMRADAAEQLEAEDFNAAAYYQVIRAELAAADAARLTALPAGSRPPADTPGEREQVIEDVARDFLSRGVTPADLAPYRTLSPLGEVGDAMMKLSGGGR